ncbi:galactose-3-O-sulfotransferase 3 [Corythoichthys intestinalis]|uniref:galactose-3-O-sulfotransferase 3 n=1 Tax=Corythoichthys intestinalis TaxID=161448 RepID=UPI0025A5317B|nr:galactose-3-O-sulfotransferase 3 [Corythoichthys intestinalis]
MSNGERGNSTMGSTSLSCRGLESGIVGVAKSRMKMWRKKTAVVFIAVIAVTLLVHCSGRWSWIAQHLRSRPKAKHTNVAFLKTHKTASSTVQNILFRFAERNNLTVALPVRQCGHQFCYPKPFNDRFVHPRAASPNIIGNHMRFNAAELRRLMPNDTCYVTILREPTAMFESLFSYYRAAFARVPDGSLDAFLEQPWRYYRPRNSWSNYARNTLTFDLGGDKDRPQTDAEYARSFAAEVERIFSLVMIAEHFDESLVLLRHLLSWDPDDLVYLNLNMRTPKSKRRLTPGQADKIRAWNWIDAHLYDHFNASLWRRLSALGLDYVRRDISVLQATRERMLRSCFGGRLPRPRLAERIRNKELRPWQPNPKVGIVGYELPDNVTQQLCLKLITPEISYTRNLMHS